MSLWIVLVAMGTRSVARADEPESPSADASLDVLRERFRAGMQEYNVGAFDRAIEIWESIYKELGAEKGYRLAFNIARAYDQLATTRRGTAASIGDAATAAKYYQAYVLETTRRAESNETLEPLIAEQATEAKTHLGSIRVAGDPSIAVKLDDEESLRHAGSVLWVAPGQHVVTYQPDTDTQQYKSVFVQVGREEVVHFDPAPSKPRVTPPPARPQIVMRRERPFDKAVLFIAAGATVASVIAPVIFYANATAIKDDFNVETSRSRAKDLTAEYNTARTTAYASWAIPGLLGAATIGLSAYWVLESRDVPALERRSLAIGGAFDASGATLTARGRF